MSEVPEQAPVPEATPAPVAEAAPSTQDLPPGLAERVQAASTPAPEAAPAEPSYIASSNCSWSQGIPCCTGTQRGRSSWCGASSRT